jgi:hypothetical protein
MSLEFIALLLDNNSVVNGRHESVRVADTIRNWARDLTEFQGFLAEKKFPADYSLFVPDFWHIAYGDAKCLPAEEADALWSSTVNAREAAMPYLKAYELVVTPHPGSRLHLSPDPAEKLTTEPT